MLARKHGCIGTRIRCLSPSNPGEQRAGGVTRKIRNRFEAPTPFQHFGSSHRRLDCVIASLHDDVGMAPQDQRQRRVLVEGNDDAHRFQRGQYRGAVGERIERPVPGLAKATDRAVGIDADDQRSTQAARMVQIRDMAPVHDVENAVREHTRTRQRGEPLVKRRRIDDLGGESRLARRGAERAHQSMYSNSRTTRCTPPVVRAMSAAASASAWRTRPMRYTTARSVTTLTWLAENLLASTNLALTLEVMNVSLLREPRSVTGPTMSSSCTARTFVVSRASFSTSFLADSEGT